MVRHSAVALTAVFLASMVAAGTPTTARGGIAEIIVTTTDDELNADGDCSLREAVEAANSNAAVDACPAGSPGPDADVVRVEAATYRLALPGADEDLNASGDLDVTEALNVLGPIGGFATIDASGLDRAFDVHPGVGRWSFAFLVVANGDAGAGDGGGILLRDHVCAGGDPSSLGTIEAVTIEGSRAARGGGIHIGACHYAILRLSAFVDNTADVAGGGLSMVGSLTHANTVTISGNTTAGTGGGIHADIAGPPADLRVLFSTVATNTAASGGGVWSQAGVHLDGTIVADNGGGNCAGAGAAFMAALTDDETCIGISTDDARLLPLKRVGGTYVHRLGQDSPAIELAGSEYPGGGCAPELISDQLGTLRPIDGNGDGVAHCDYGAIEAPQGSAAPPESPAPSPGTLPDTAVPAPAPTAGGAGPLAVLVGAALTFALTTKRTNARVRR